MTYVILSTLVQAQKTNSQTSVELSSPVVGYHVGLLQTLFSINNGKLRKLDQSSFYTIGIPIGITLKTPGKVMIDLEFVPFFHPHFNTDNPYQVHLLFHPGVLFPLGDNWTFGLRAAFETGVNQFGITPLLNKSFKLNSKSRFFIELVAPGRWGPEKNSGYTQLCGLHLGVSF